MNLKKNPLKRIVFHQVHGHSTKLRLEGGGVTCRTCVSCERPAVDPKLLIYFYRWDTYSEALESF